MTTRSARPRSTPMTAIPAIPQYLAPMVRSIVGLSNLYRPHPGSVPVPNSPMAHATAYDGVVTPKGQTNSGGLPPGIDGTGQTIGLVELDNYDDKDVKAWLSLVSLDSSLINHVSRFPIAGGVSASNGGGTTEVLHRYRCRPRHGPWSQHHGLRRPQWHR